MVDELTKLIDSFPKFKLSEEGACERILQLISVQKRVLSDGQVNEYKTLLLSYKTEKTTRP